MSAKRRTTALVSGVFRWAPIASASPGLELPATSLIAPFLASIMLMLLAGQSVRRRRDTRDAARLAIWQVRADGLFLALSGERAGGGCPLSLSRYPCSTAPR